MAGVTGCETVLLSFDEKKKRHQECGQQQASASTFTVCSILVSSFMLTPQPRISGIASDVHPSSDIMAHSHRGKPDLAITLKYTAVQLIRDCHQLALDVGEVIPK